MGLIIVHIITNTIIAFVGLFCGWKLRKSAPILTPDELDPSKEYCLMSKFFHHDMENPSGALVILRDLSVKKYNKAFLVIKLSQEEAKMVSGFNERGGFDGGYISRLAKERF